MAVLDLGVNTWRDVGGLQNQMPFFRSGFLTENKKVCGSLVCKMGNWRFIVTYSQTLK